MWVEAMEQTKKQTLKKVRTMEGKRRENGETGEQMERINERDGWRREETDRIHCPNHIINNNTPETWNIHTPKHTLTHHEHNTQQETRETREEQEEGVNNKWQQKKHVRCIATHNGWGNLRLNTHRPRAVSGSPQNKQQERRWEGKPTTHWLVDEHTHEENKHTHISHTQPWDWSTVYDMCILHKSGKKQNWSAL